ncbi:MAG: signal peptide peptidase SppA [Candidatus Margulisiibacteriota bacterium]
MKKYTILIALCFLLILPASAQDEFAQYGFNVRAAGMGSAFTAIADDASAVYYNPAGLPLSAFRFNTESLDWERSQNTFSDLTLLSIDGFGYANFRQSAKNGQSIQGQLIGMGTRGRNGFSWGLTYKELGHRGKGLDLGLLVNITDYLSMGILGQNISVLDLDNEFTLRTGLAYRLLSGTVLLSVDHVHYNHEEDRLYYGIETVPVRGFTLRGGVADKRGTYGIGLTLPAGELNYAVDFDPEQNDGRIHKLGFCLKGDEHKLRKYALFADKKFLEIEIRGDVVRGQDEFSILGGFSQGTDTLLNYLRQANRDKDIDGYLIRMSGFPSSLFAAGMVQSLREELDTARGQGKKVIFYLEGGAIGNAYYLASVADKIIAPEIALIGGIGTRFQILRMHKLYKKLGIGWDILAKGKYKASFNDIDKEISPEGEESIRSLVKDVYERMLIDIADGRDMDIDKVRILADGSLMSAGEALLAGLIDEIGYYSEAKKSAGQLLGLEKEQEPPLLTLQDLDPEIDSESLFMPWNRIAVINVEGTITLGKNSSSFLWGGMSTGADTVVEQIKQAGNDPTVRAIIMRLNTEGGSAIAADRIYLAINKVRENGKVVIASMGNIAASGGYYIAAACDRVIANPSTFTGSIGVIGMFPNLKELFDNIGVEAEEYTEGKYMDSFSMAKKLSPEARAMFENVMQKTYDQFILAVAKGRDIPETEVRKLAEGRLYTGSQAVQNGLVDEMGNFSWAVTVAKKLSGIDGEEKLVYYKEDGNMWLQQIGMEATKILGLEKGLLPEIKAGFPAFQVY